MSYGDCTLGILAKLTDSPDSDQAASIEQETAKRLLSPTRPVRGIKPDIYSSSNLQLTPSGTGLRARTNTPRRRILKKIADMNMPSCDLGLFVEEKSTPIPRKPSATDLAEREKLEKKLPPLDESTKSEKLIVKKGLLDRSLSVVQKKRTPTQRQVMGNVSASLIRQAYLKGGGDAHWGHLLSYNAAKLSGENPQRRRNLVAIHRAQNLRCDTRTDNALKRKNRRHSLNITYKTTLSSHPTKKRRFVDIPTSQTITVSPLSDRTNRVSMTLHNITVPKNPKAFSFTGKFFAAGIENKLSFPATAAAPKL